MPKCDSPSEICPFGQVKSLRDEIFALQMWYVRLCERGKVSATFFYYVPQSLFYIEQSEYAKTWEDNRIKTKKAVEALLLKIVPLPFFYISTFTTRQKLHSCKARTSLVQSTNFTAQQLHSCKARTSLSKKPWRITENSPRSFFIF